MTRTWKCPGCGRTIRHSYEALAEVGNPICSNEDCADFDDELELLPETKTRLAIVLEGGLVTAVVSDHPERFADVDTIVIDYDTEGADAQDITFVPQGKSKTAEALVRRETIEQASDLDIVCRNLNGEKTS